MKKTPSLSSTPSRPPLPQSSPRQQSPHSPQQPPRLRPIFTVLLLLSAIAVASSIVLAPTTTSIQNAYAPRQCPGCAWDFSPGHDVERNEGESARDFAPGQEAKEWGDPELKQNARDFAPGHEKGETRE